MGSYRSNPVFQVVKRVLDDDGIEFDIDDTGRHLKIKFEVAGRQVQYVAGSTPSDVMAPMNARATIRRIIREAKGEGQEEIVNAPVQVEGLAYRGVVIHDDGEMLSLTDMWRAHGGVSAKQPSNWLSSADAVNFIEVLNPGNSGIIAKRGKGGGTFAHWQIAMAYAKYLSPEFHMWCNTIVRAYMSKSPAIQAALPNPSSEMIERTFGIAKMLGHKLAGIETSVGKISEVATALDLLLDETGGLRALIEAIRPTVVQLPAPEPRVTASETLTMAGLYLVGDGRGVALHLVTRPLVEHCRREGVEVGRRDNVIAFPRPVVSDWLASNVVRLRREAPARFPGRVVVRPMRSMH